MRLITVIDAAGTSRRFKAFGFTEDDCRLTVHGESDRPVAVFLPGAWQAVFDEEET